MTRLTVLAAPRKTNSTAAAQCCRRVRLARGTRSLSCRLIASGEGGVYHVAWVFMHVVKIMYEYSSTKTMIEPYHVDRFIRHVYSYLVQVQVLVLYDDIDYHGSLLILL